MKKKEFLSGVLLSRMNPWRHNVGKVAFTRQKKKEIFLRIFLGQLWRRKDWAIKKSSFGIITVTSSIKGQKLILMILLRQNMHGVSVFTGMRTGAVVSKCLTMLPW